MDFRRSVLWIIFAVSLMMLFENWQHFNGRPSIFFASPEPKHVVQQPTSAPTGQLPTDAAGATVVPSASAATGELLQIKTDVYQASVDTLGGTLSKLELIQADKGADKGRSERNVTLFDKTPTHTYLARTGLIGGNFPNHNDVFTVLPGPLELTEEMNTLKVQLEAPLKDGLQLIKSYTFTRGSYVISVQHEIINTGTQPVKPTLYTELVRDSTPVETPRFSHTFIGPAFYTEQQHFQKISFSDIDKGKAATPVQADNGWIALVQHHFVSAWIGQPGAAREIYIDKTSPTLYRIGVKEPVPEIKPGERVTLSDRLFAGPQQERMLEGIAPGLELVKDYGWVTIIAKPLFWLLEKIHNVLGNWGWSIVMLTLLIKAVFFPLSAASYRSMARMKEIMPRMQTLRERFKNDPQKMNAALMELYKAEKVNPFGGCLPVLVQIPVFISLYWVLLSSVEMRGAPWLGWIQDLSQQDPYFILPVLMAVSMLVQTRLNPTPPDPLQAKLMMLMPVVFSVMFFFFPAGLVLYYVVNNVLSIAQQWYMTAKAGQRSKIKKARAN